LAARDRGGWRVVWFVCTPLLRSEQFLHMHTACDAAFNARRTTVVPCRCSLLYRSGGGSIQRRIYRWFLLLGINLRVVPTAFDRIAASHFCHPALSPPSLDSLLWRLLTVSGHWYVCRCRRTRTLRRRLAALDCARAAAGLPRPLYVPSAISTLATYCGARGFLVQDCAATSH